jgi:hypothetical protein
LHGSDSKLEAEEKARRQEEEERLKLEAEEKARQEEEGRLKREADETYPISRLPPTGFCEYHVNSSTEEAAAKKEEAVRSLHYYVCAKLGLLEGQCAVVGHGDVTLRRFHGDRVNVVCLPFACDRLRAGCCVLDVAC